MGTASQVHCPSEKLLIFYLLAAPPGVTLSSNVAMVGSWLAGQGWAFHELFGFFWYSNNSVNYSSGRIEYRIPSRQSFLCRIVTDKCQIVTDEPNGNFFHFQYETVYCQAVAHCTALVSSLESRSSVKVDWGVQVPRLLLCRSNFCHYLIYLL